MMHKTILNKEMNSNLTNNKKLCTLKHGQIIMDEYIYSTKCLNLLYIFTFIYELFTHFFLLQFIIPEVYMKTNVFIHPFAAKKIVFITHW